MSVSPSRQGPAILPDAEVRARSVLKYRKRAARYDATCGPTWPVRERTVAARQLPPGRPLARDLEFNAPTIPQTLTFKLTVTAAFTAIARFDVGTDPGSPVSRDDFDRRPFRFDGKIERLRVNLK